MSQGDRELEGIGIPLDWSAALVDLYAARVDAYAAEVGLYCAQLGQPPASPRTVLCQGCGAPLQPSECTCSYCRKER